MHFNNIDFNNYFKILDIRRNLIPPVSTNRTNIPGRDGKYNLNKSMLDENYIEVDVEIKSDTREDKRGLARELAWKLFTREEEKLILNDETDKYYMAKLDSSTDIQEIYIYSVITLKFLCSDPIAYGKTIKNNINGDTTLFLAGTYKTKPKLTFNITSAIDYAEIRNLSKGKLVRVNHNFIAGDKLEIDFNDKWKVRKNGVVIAEDVTIESDFFYLHPGENKLRTNIAGELEYIERWL